ncbi:AAA family ATPase [Congregibacter litoralis]|uniref:AAA family ATPase n=1 Tax=Congregibacter litoralis TaxID=393662 RepID=UPI00006B84C2
MQKKWKRIWPHDLSDGEKQVFSILVDVIELTEEQSVLFVDEPELNLNPGLANRLWTSIESLLPLAVFIYATHSVNFALRETVQRLLVLSNNDESIQELAGLDELSFEDQKALLGNIPSLIAHKNALIVEGYDESFDGIFYRWILSELNVVPSPVGASEDVTAMATRHGKWARVSPEVRLTGIIDRDFKSDDAVQSLENKGLIVLGMHEAENYLCDPELLHALAGALGTLEKPLSRAEFEQELFDYLNENELEICAKRTNARLNLNIRPSVPSKTLKKVASYADLERAFIENVSSQMAHANTVFDEQSVKAALEDERTRLQAIKSGRDVHEALKLLPGKELLKRYAKSLGLTDTNSLARAVRKHLDVESFPAIAVLKTRLYSIVSGTSNPSATNQAQAANSVVTSDN